MDWNQLLNETRRKINPKSGELQDYLSENRNQFERDYDRVIFTSSFRRLQDKAQVFPLEASDFVRTRLTHTVEVSTIGRSLALDVGRRLMAEEKVKYPEFDTKIASIVATSCLLHDVGNPPFGHFGESAIQEWFTHEFKIADQLCLTKQQKHDFMHFEGNAQALRIATRLQMHNHDCGLNLTYATLSSMIKYPCSSTEFDSDSNDKSLTKPGYFASEAEVFAKICGETGTNGRRHPLVFLMEAADDIAYSVIDIEDAVKKGVLSFDDVLKFIEDEKRDLKNRFPLMKKLMNDLASFMGNEDHKKLPEPNQVYMHQFRILAHSFMIRACSNAFLANYTEIMEGTYSKSLVEDSDAGFLYEALKDLAKEKVYVAKSVLTLEYLGKEVIYGLLDRFVPAVLDVEHRKKTKTSAGKLYHLISPAFRHIELCAGDEPMVYNRLQLVTDFICGMTDTYALDLYQRLTGVKIS